MSQPVPENYDEIKRPFYDLVEGDLLEVKPGILEKIVRRGRAGNFASFAMTESGLYRENGNGVKANSPNSASN